MPRQRPEPARTTPVYACASKRFELLHVNAPCLCIQTLHACAYEWSMLCACKHSVLAWNTVICTIPACVDCSGLRFALQNCTEARMRGSFCPAVCAHGQIGGQLRGREGGSNGVSEGG
eukprot:363280-Chlamydomonas_euryale.AAC.1